MVHKTSYSLLFKNSLHFDFYRNNLICIISINASKIKVNNRTHIYECYITGLVSKNIIISSD